jgi:capsular exopolysaccharide synthesis family protein
LAIAFLEFRSRKIDSTDAVVYGLGMPLVGTLPCMPSRSRRLVGANGAAVRWKGMLTESVDAVRTLLLHAAHSEGLRVVMVTSAVGGEGKTSLSCHLAASLARSGRKTLLVDGDMRNPSCHRMFEVELESGLSELLRGEIEVTEAIHTTPAPTLSVLPAGQCDAVALQSMAQGNLKPIFAQLREQFDFIIVDSCPVLPVADSLLLGQQADAVLLSLLRDVSRMPKVYAAYQRLAMLGIRMLGAVVSGTQEAAYGSNYHYIVPKGREQAAV